MEEQTVEQTVNHLVDWRYIIYEEEGTIVISEIARIERDDEYVSYYDAMGDEYEDGGFFLANTLSDAKEMAQMAANALKNDVVQVRYCSAVGSEALLFKALKQ